MKILIAALVMNLIAVALCLSVLVDGVDQGNEGSMRAKLLLNLVLMLGNIMLIRRQQRRNRL